jgi:putative DNA primase/helicase
MDLTLSVADDVERHALTVTDDEERRRWGAFASKSRSRAGRVAMLKNAESHPELALTPESLDRDKWSLVVRNGVLDLRTSTFTRPRREDLCTRAADVAYDPAATCPRWEEFVRFVTCDDAELATYLRRLAGYTLTGDTTAHAFFSLEGVGANGKNVFVETLMFMMGDYATVASTKLLTQGDKSHAAIVADLAGARLVFVDEIPQGKHVDVERMKSFTGSARIKAQHMRENWFFFEPQMKFWIAGNEQPRFKDSSDGIWRRMHRILFRAKVSEEQKIADYARILHEEEGAGILNWCLAGLRDFHERGKKLDAPESVKAAVIELRTDEDHFAAFVDECLEVTGDATLTGDWITNAQLFQLYTGWCDANGVSKVDRHNGVHLSRTVAKMPGLERFNDRRSGKRERGFGGVRAATSALSIMGGALL